MALRPEGVGEGREAIHEYEGCYSVWDQIGIRIHSMESVYTLELIEKYREKLFAATDS